MCLEKCARIRTFDVLTNLKSNYQLVYSSNCFDKLFSITMQLFFVIRFFNESMYK